MLVEIERSILEEENPILHAICQKMDIPQYVVEVTEKCIIFRDYSRAILHHHFNDSRTQALFRSIMSGGRRFPISIILFENSLHGDYSYNIWWQYHKENSDEEEFNW